MVESLAADVTTNLTGYAHFNTGYPFLGVDEYVADMVKGEMKFYRPDITCDFDNTLNPWSICYWRGDCSPDTFGDANLTFAFGTNATFIVPMSELMINYTASGNDMCGVGIQRISNMPFDTTVERHFFFGDIFFKSFVGVFNFDTMQLGMAKSVFAPATVELQCAGVSCSDPAPTPDPPTPPTPPTPDPEDNNDTTLLWLWIVIGLAVLILVILCCAVVYSKR